MPYVDPGDVVTGTTITSTWGDNVRNALQYLANPPACRVYNSGVISCANNGFTTLTFNSERWDTDSMHSTASATDRITINTAGLYVIGAGLEMAAAADYQHVRLAVQIGGVATIAYLNSGSVVEASASPSVHLTTVYKLTAGQYLQAVVYQKNGAGAARNALATPNLSPEFWATWIGLG